MVGRLRFPSPERFSCGNAFPLHAQSLAKRQCACANDPWSKPRLLVVFPRSGRDRSLLHQIRLPLARRLLYFQGIVLRVEGGAQQRSHLLRKIRHDKLQHR